MNEEPDTIPQILCLNCKCPRLIINGCFAIILCSSCSKLFPFNILESKFIKTFYYPFDRKEILKWFISVKNLPENIIKKVLNNFDPIICKSDGKTTIDFCNDIVISELSEMIKEEFK